MNAHWNDRTAGDIRLDDRLRELDEHLTEVFAVDLDDPDQLAAFSELVDRQAARGVRAPAHRQTSSCDALGSTGSAVTRRLSGTGAHRRPVAVARSHSIGIRVAIACASAMVLVAALLVATGVVTPFHPSNLTKGSDLEKPDLKFSLMTTTDLGPFLLAVERGDFKKAGFTFDPAKDVSVATSGSESVAKLMSNDVDIAYATYAPFFLAQSWQLADIRLVADASSAGPNSCMVVVMPHSKIRNVRDLAGARVAVTARNTIAELMVVSALKTNGVDHTGIQWVTAPFPDTTGMLNRGEIDAAFLTEPFLSHAQRTIGAVPLFDTATGPTTNIPTAGFGANAEFVRKYPKTVTAFQNIMRQATTDATADRTKVEPLLQRFAKVDAETARSATLLTFQSALDVNRIQRVADLMLEFGMIKEKLDASRIIAKPADSR
jgi:NitT/TauT family transport system substrate-binding protein